jgi:hypothetical protein
MDFSLTRINADLEVSTKIWLQLCDLKDAIRIGEKDREALFRWAIDLIRKLEGVKYHGDNLLRILNEEFKKRANQTDPTNLTEVDLTTGAERELEAFLMQGKSTLDVLVKIFVPLFGLKLHSYGDGGAKVAKALRRNLKSDQLARAENLLRLIDTERHWIEKWFGSQRDTVAHYRPIQSRGFITPPVTDGVPRHAPPALDDGTPFHELVTVLYHNLLTFCEDFLVLAVSIQFPPMIKLGVVPEDKRDREHPGRYGMFLVRPEPKPGEPAT